MIKRNGFGKGARLAPILLIFVMLFSGLGMMLSAEEGTSGNESSITVTTDKYTYFIGESVHITIIGQRVGSSTEFSRGYLIKDEFSNWVRDGSQIITCDVVISLGPDNYTWNQQYELINEYNLLGNYNIHFPKNGEQVSTGKYYIYPCPGSCEPAEIEIVTRSPLEIEKIKISGPDEVETHTYNEWELKITVTNPYTTTSLQPVFLDILLFEGVNIEDTALAIENMGGTILNISTSWRPMMRVSVTPNLIDDIAHLHAVNWIQLVPMFVFFDFWEKETLNHGTCIEEIEFCSYQDTLLHPRGTRGSEEDGKLLLLKAGNFDPVYGEPNFLIPSLSIEGYEDNIEGLWLVQWSEAPLRETCDKVEELGAEILAYIPKHAYIVRMTNEVKNEVANLSFVRAIVLFQPQYKMSPYLISSYKEYFDIDLRDNIQIENVVVNDVLPAELELLNYELTQGTLVVTKKGKGKMGSTHLTWHVGDLEGQAELTLKVATTKNPAGKQEFTSPGIYIINEGATATGIVSATGKKIEAGPTEPITVVAHDDDLNTEVVCGNEPVYVFVEWEPLPDSPEVSDNGETSDESEEEEDCACLTKSDEEEREEKEKKDEKVSQVPRATPMSENEGDFAFTLHVIFLAYICQFMVLLFAVRRYNRHWKK